MYICPLTHTRTHIELKADRRRRLEALKAKIEVANTTAATAILTTSVTLGKRVREEEDGEIEQPIEKKRRRTLGAHPTCPDPLKLQLRELWNSNGLKVTTNKVSHQCI